MKKGFQKARDCAGNVLFMILIAVVLFAALSYAVMQSDRGSGNVKDEKQKLLEAEFNQYQASINWAVDILKLGRRCENVFYTPPAQQNPVGDKSCYVFHPKGGGVAWRDLDCPAEQKLALQEGEFCNGIIYAGTHGGHRIYALAWDSGRFAWDTAPFLEIIDLPGTDKDNGLNNTNTILAAPGGAGKYPAAATCRALGEEWYLPAQNELSLLYTKRNTRDFIGTFITNNTLNCNSETDHSCYWSSSQRTIYNAWNLRFGDGTEPHHAKNHASFSVRCVRR